jgi:hypothetical protein
MDVVDGSYRLGPTEDENILFYDMKFDTNGTLWISSRLSNPKPPGISGIFSFKESVFTQEATFKPYSLLISEDGAVYATAYDNTIKTYVSTGNWDSVVITTDSIQNRGMAFDDKGNIWIASTTNHNSGYVVYSYDPGTGLPGPSYTLTSTGTAPVGMGKDASGNMWAVCRSDNDYMNDGYIEGFNPETLIQVGAIQVGYRPYAYSGFIMPEPELYSLCGFKYNEETGEGIGGWEITLENLFTHETWTTTTTAFDGSYCFEDLPPGEYKVSEGFDPNWEQVFPGGYGTHTVTLPDDSGKILYGTERLDTGENGLFEINLDTKTSVEIFDTGGSVNSPNGLGFDWHNNRLYYMKYENSQSSLYFHELGSVIEHYAGLTVEKLVVGASFYEGAYYYIPNAIADIHKVTLASNGMMIDDINLHQNFNGTNPAVYRFGDFAIDKAGMLYASTNGDGEFYSFDLLTGSYKLISKVNAIGIQLSFGSDGTLYGHNAVTGMFYTINIEDGSMVELFEVGTDGIVKVLFSDLASGDQPHYYNFRNRELFDICGYKFNYDTDEGIEGWEITLLDSAGAEVTTTTTSALGMYCFNDLSAGTYTVEETTQSGWVQKIPLDGYYEVNLPDEASDCTAILGVDTEDLFYNFVNEELKEICGYKYRTGTEIGLGGWLITLEKFVEGNGWTLVDTEVTDIYGAYCFEDLLEGDYRISETPKEGWTKTAPLDDFYLVTLPLGVEELETLFDFYNDPEMACYDDSIWAYGGKDGAYTDIESAADKVMANNTVDGNSSNNWGWTNRIDEQGTYVFTLYRGAGQNDLEKGTPVGTLTVVYNLGLADVTYSVVAPYELSEVHLWIGKTALPMIEKKVKKVLTDVPTSAPGQLSKLGYSPEISEDGLTATIEAVEITAPFWVAAHGVVDWCEMIASEGTTYYHWEEGYPYGASPEVFATASVTSIGMDVWWFQGGQWFHDIYNITETLGFTPYTVGSLNEPVKMLHEMHFPGLEDTWYQRTPVDVSEVPVPNAMSILIY